MLTGKLATLVILATLLAVVGAWGVARHYRAAMQRLMSAPPADSPLMPPPVAAPVALPVATVTLDDNRRAYRRLITLFASISLLMSLTHALTLEQLSGSARINWETVAILTLVMAWPIVLVLGVIERWSRRRVALLLAAWFVGAVLLIAWRTSEAVALSGIVAWMSFAIGIPLLLVSAVCLGNATRAIAPWLLPLFVLLAGAAQLGLDALSAMIDSGTGGGALRSAAEAFGHWGVILFFALAPMLLAWWPAKQLGHWLATAYAKQRFSELFYLFTAVWVLSLITPALGAASESWRGALATFFLPLAWIPFSYPLLRAVAPVVPRQKRAPTLLVLRVFQKDASIQNLFDRVIERWRLTGNTVLIAGTDLTERTIDAEDIFTFIDGRLAERFIYHPDEIEAKLSQFELEPDIEGRYRVNECYCHDSTWQQALDRLIAISDVVLMDLRGFRKKNKGCLYELGVLAAAPAIGRVVILANPGGDRDKAEAAAAAAPEGRFIWIDIEPNETIAPEQVLAALLHSAP
jgi:hypothetical protein